MLEISNNVVDIKQVVLEIKYILSFKIQEKGLEILVDFAENIPEFVLPRKPNFETPVPFIKERYLLSISRTSLTCLLMILFGAIPNIV